MIFFTVGTHEQGFERLIEEADNLIADNVIDEDVFVQKGYTLYTPKHCKYKDFIGFDEMNKYVKKARIIVTHGGPGSIMIPWKFNKVPIVVPRNPEFNEHVDNHQILFTKRLENMRKVIGVYEINNLKDKIVNYEKICENLDVKFHTNNINFTNSIEEIANKLVGVR